MAEEGAVTRLAPGTIIEPGSFYTFEENKDFTFGLGKEDKVTLIDALNNIIDEFAWTGGHAAGTYGREVDGEGEMVDLAEATKNASNAQEEKPVENPEETKQALIINEVDSNPADWVEILNQSMDQLDLSGYELRDDSDDHRWKFLDGSLIAPGEFLVVEATTPGKIYDDQTKTYVEGTFEAAIGIGGGDKIRLYDLAGNLLDEISWTEHAAVGKDTSLATVGRYKDGGDNVMVMPPTPGQANDTFAKDLVINEVESKDPNGGSDWIEFYNPLEVVMDLSGLTIKDNDDSHAYVIPDGTVIDKLGYLVFDETMFGYGLGKEDKGRVFDQENLLTEYGWAGHAENTLGLRPDGTYGDTSEATPGAVNKFADVAPDEGTPIDDKVTDILPWLGTDKVIIVDDVPTFLEDSSGLDFHEGALYAVDNGTGMVWKLNMDNQGQLTFAEGWEKGKRVRFQKDADNPDAKGPDAEGISLDSEGMIYLAVERDNSNKGVNYNVILQANPEESGPDIIASMEWNLTDSLPQVSANMGIEAVEWVANDDIAGKIIDQNTGQAYDPSLYSDAIANGLFFVALEDNGHVYAYVLNQDGTSKQIADVDSNLGGAMSLDYDKCEKVLWVSSDNGYDNKLAKINFEGKEQPKVDQYKAPGELDTDNHEGFAIANILVDGYRPAFWFTDGLKEGSLKQGWFPACEKKPVDPIDPVKPEVPVIDPIIDPIESEIDSEVGSGGDAIVDPVTTVIEPIVNPAKPAEEPEQASLPQGTNEKDDAVVNDEQSVAQEKPAAKIEYHSKTDKTLPETGEQDLTGIFSFASLAILAGLGLVSDKLLFNKEEL